MIIAIDVGKSLHQMNMVETNETNQVLAVMTYTPTYDLWLWQHVLSS